jgi:hypothetical protein
MDRFDIETHLTAIRHTPLPLRNQEWLRQQHHEFDLSFSEIAERVDYSVRTATVEAAGDANALLEIEPVGGAEQYVNMTNGLVDGSSMRSEIIDTI